MNDKPARRVVTGIDAAGQSVIESDGPAANVISPLPGLIFHQVWQTSAMPAPVLAPNTSAEIRGVEPPKNGTVIRVLDIPPIGSMPRDRALVEKSFETLGAAHATVKSDRTANMHKTVTVDYGIVITGELTLILDRGETTLYPGDICVQRGTVHGWENRGTAPCRIVFVLIDGTEA
jgi:quercetin dioxygenase-like cupin family protein